MARRGRPKLGASVVRSKALVVRLRPAEHEQIRAAAKASGIGLAPFARAGALEAAGRQPGVRPPTPVDPTGTDAGIRREPRRIGINLNQIARTLNRGATVSECSPALIAQVEELRELLVKELIH